MAHGDYTGQTKQRLAHKFAEEQALASQSKTLVTQVVTEGNNAVIDLWCDKDDENLALLQERASEEGVVSVDVDNPDFHKVRFRASEDLDQVTVGQDREFSLKAGRTYEAPRWVVSHLDDKGLVWH